MTDLRPILGTNANDRWASYIKNLVGLAPWAGPFLGEYLAAKIPDQRADRVERYLVWLTEELDRKTGGVRPTLSEQAEALFEESLSEAVRPMSDERRRRLSRIIATGMTGDEILAQSVRKMLFVFRDLDDYELSILFAFRQNRMQNHLKLRGGGLDWRSEEASRLRHIGDIADIKLERLGLIKFKQSFKILDGERTPRYKNSGEPEGTYDITRFGKEVADLAADPNPTTPPKMGDPDS